MIKLIQFSSDKIIPYEYYYIPITYPIKISIFNYNKYFYTVQMAAYRKTNSKGIEYEFVDSIPEITKPITFYNTRSTHYDFDEDRYYYQLYQNKKLSVYKPQLMFA